MTELSLAEYSKMVGQSVGVSRWFEIIQQRINQFADVTEDWQFIHIDPEEAAKTSFGGPVAHGFLTLSLLPAMAYDALPKLSGCIMAVNYGFDKIRFIAPVRSGGRVQAQFVLREVIPRGEKEVLFRTEATIRIEGMEKPALVADWLGLSIFS